MTHIHINAPKAIDMRCHVIDCPTCERPRRMLVLSYEWYGSNITCAGCGERWVDGERLERPFMPGWRKKGIEAARQTLASIGVQA